VSLVELLVALAILGLLASLAVAATLDSMPGSGCAARARDPRHDGHRAVEAQRRNHACRFAIDATSGAYQVIDTLGTSTTTDDVVLSAPSCHGWVAVEAPDTTTPVTLQPAGGASSTRNSNSPDGLPEVARSRCPAPTRLPASRSRPGGPARAVVE